MKQLSMQMVHFYKLQKSLFFIFFLFLTVPKLCKVNTLAQYIDSEKSENVNKEAKYFSTFAKKRILV